MNNCTKWKYVIVFNSLAQNDDDFIAFVALGCKWPWTEICTLLYIYTAFAPFQLLDLALSRYNRVDKIAYKQHESSCRPQWIGLMKLPPTRQCQFQIDNILDWIVDEKLYVFEKHLLVCHCCCLMLVRGRKKTRLRSTLRTLQVGPRKGI